jgi:hypothetical protein
MAKIIQFKTKTVPTQEEKFIKRTCENCHTKEKNGVCPHLNTTSAYSMFMLEHQEEIGFCIDHEFENGPALGIYTIAEDEDHMSDEAIIAIRKKAKEDEIWFDMLNGKRPFIPMQ